VLGTPSFISAGQINVPFTAPVNNGKSTITSYTVLIDPTGATSTLTQSGSGTFNLTGLTPAAIYQFKIYATNNMGNSTYSAFSAPVQCGTVPGAPTIGTVTVTGSTSMTVVYTAPVNNGGAAITQYIATSSPGSITGTLNQAGSGTITVNGLQPDTPYSFTVVAVNAVGQSANSGVSSTVSTQRTFIASVELLAVGGGGSGQGKRTGGGGAGGLVYYGTYSTPRTPDGGLMTLNVGTNYTIGVGAGSLGASGTATTFVGGAYNITAGGGAVTNGGSTSGSSGSPQSVGGTNRTQTGYPGGAGAAGAGGVGGATVGGDGGIGFQYPQFSVLSGASGGKPTGTVSGGWFAGGGGGGAELTASNGQSGGNGGIGGGGAGGYGPYSNNVGSAGALGNPGFVNSGGGGGGTSDLHPADGGRATGSGGSGIVIVCYPGSTIKATGGNTISTSLRSGYVLHVFTASGTFAPSGT
jgi:hypothetical protein